MLNFAIIGCGRIAQRHTEQAAIAGKLLAVIIEPGTYAGNPAVRITKNGGEIQPDAD